MATEIDKRVVEMQFDNRDFEKNCQASLTTLEKLKMALNFDGAKGLDSMAKAANKIDLSNISKGAEAVEVRFNAMNVAGMTAISELTKGFLNLGKTIWNASFGQMKSGGMARTLKIEQANFQMEALAKNMDVVKDKTMTVTEVVTKMGEAASKAVDGTSYGLDAASSVAAQLMASGLSDAEKMYDHLRAIAGAAAMTGRSYEDIGNIFTTVASNGRLMTMQLRQFSAAGLNLSATLAQSLGKTEEQINQMVTKGQISFEQFSDALSGAFGEAAGKADDTFSGVTSNVKAQLSRIGQLFTDPFVKHMIPFLKEVKASIKNIRDAMAPLGQTFGKVFGHFTRKATDALHSLELSRLRKIFNGVENILGGIILSLDAIRQAFAEVFPPKTIEDIRDAAAKFEEMSRKIIPTTETLNGLKEVIKAILIPVKLAFQLFKTLWQSAILPIVIALSKLLGAFLRFGNALAPIIDGIVNIIVQGEFLNSVFSILAATIIVVLDAITQLTMAIGIVLGRIVSSTTFVEIINALHDIAHVISVTIVNALLLAFNIIKKIFSFINVENILKVVDGITAALGFIINAVGLAITTIANIIDGIANSGTILGKVFQLFQKIVELIKDVFSGNDTSGHLKDINSLIQELKKSIEELFTKLFAYLRKIDAGQILVFAFGLSVIFLIMSVTKLTNAFTGLVKATTSAVGILGGIKKAIANIGKFSPVFQLLVGFALAIGAVTSALITLSRDTDPERLKQAAIILGIFAAGIVILAGAITYFSSKIKEDGDSSAIHKMTINIMAIAGAVLILSIAVGLMSKANITLSQIVAPLVTIILLISAMTTAAILLGKYSGEGAKGSLAILAFAISIDILVKSFIRIINLKIEDVKQAVYSIIALFGLMIVLAISMSSMGRAGVKASTGFALIGFMASLFGIILLMKMLAKFNYAEMQSAFLRLVMLMTPIVAFLGVATFAVRLAKTGDLIGQLASMLMALNLIMVVMTACIMLLGNLDVYTLAKGSIAVRYLSRTLTGMVQMMMQAMQLTKGIDYKLVIGEMRQLNTFLKGLGITMVLLAASTLIMSKASIDGIVEVAGIMTLLMWVMKEIIPTLQYTKDAKVGPILAVITAISAIMAAMAILSFQDPVHIAATGAAIAFALAGLAFVLQKVNETPKVDKKTVDELNATKKGTALIAVAIGGIVLALAGLTYATKFIEPSQQPVLEMVLTAMAGILVAVAAFIVVAGRINNDKFSENAKNIAKIMISMVGSLLVITAALASLMVISSLTKGWGIAGMIIGLIGMGYLVNAIVYVIQQLMEIENHKNKGSLYKAANSFVIACSALAIIASSIGIIAGITALTKGWGIAGIIASVISIGLLMNAIVATFKHMIDMSKNFDRNQLKNIAVSVVIMASTYAVIASSIAILAAAMVFTGFGRVMGAMLPMALLFAELVGGLLLIIKFVEKVDEKKIKDIKSLLLLITGMYTIIAGSVALMAMLDIGDKDEFELKINALLKLVGMVMKFTGIITALVLIYDFVNKKFNEGKDFDPRLMYALESMIAVISGSMAIIALAMEVMINSVSKVNEKQLKDACAIIAIFLGAIVLITSIVGLVAGLTQVGTAVVVAMVAFSGAVAIFALAGLIIAKTIDIIVDAIIKFNNAKIDSQKLKSNIANAAEGIAAAAPAIVKAFEAIMDAIVEIMADIIKYSVVLGAASALGFVQGINESLPEILEQLKQIMQKIINFLNNDENRSIIRSFCESIGEVLYDVVSSTIEGIFYKINEEIDKLVNHGMEEKNKLANQEIEQQAQSDRVSRASKYYFGDEDYLETFRTASELYKENPNFYADVYLEKLNDLRDKLHNMSSKELDDLVVSLNKIAEQAEYAGIEIDDTLQYAVLEISQKVPKAFTDKLHPAFGLVKDDAKNTVEEIGETVSEVGNVINETASETIKNMELGSEKAKDSVETLTKELMPDLNASLSKGSEGVKTFITGLFSQLGTSAGISFDSSLLESIDFSAVTNGLKDGSFDMGDILGMISGTAAGDAYAKYFQKTVDDYYKEGSVQISAFDSKTGKSIKVPKWQTTTDETGQVIYSPDKYKDQMAWANAQYDAQEETSAMNKILTDQLNIFEDLDEEMEDATSSLTGYGDATEGTNKKFKSFVTNLHDSIKNSLNLFDEVAEEEEIDPAEMLDRMTGNIAKIGGWAHNIAVLAARGMSEGLLNELKDLGPQGAAKVKAFVNMTDEQLREANLLYGDSAALPDVATRKIVKSYQDAGFNASLGFSEGINTNAGDAAMQVLAKNALNSLEKELEIESPSKKTMKDGEYVSQGLAKGVMDPSSQMFIKAASAKISDILLKSLKDNLKPERLKNVGTQFMQGFNNGLDVPMQSIVSKITAFASRILSIFGRILKINSPSKAMEELGEYTMEGFGLGMEAGSENVEKTTENTANDILEQMKANMAAITDGWTEDNVYQPVIRPVFDMESINQGYSDIQTWFANAQGLNLSGNISRLTPTTKEEPNTNQQLIDAIKNIDNDKVVDELVSLRNDISNLQDAMTHLQVVMNSGALVGEIVEPMDVALGSRALRNQRGR